MAQTRIRAAIIGPGNIGTDLMYKMLRRSKYLELAMMVGIVESEGIRRAASLGIPTTTEGIGPVLEDDTIKIVFDATGAKPHLQHAPLLREAGKIAIDLTPAAVGPYVVPPVNLHELYDVPNVNMVTCGGQATIPLVYAVHRAAGARYAEIVAAPAPNPRQQLSIYVAPASMAAILLATASERLLWA